MVDDALYAYSYKAWAEAFSIFAKYEREGRGYDISAEHDVIYAGPHIKEVSPEDKQRLEQLRWFIDEETDCFYRYT